MCPLVPRRNAPLTGGYQQTKFTNLSIIGDFNINTLRSHTGLNKTATKFSNLLLS